MHVSSSFERQKNRTNSQIYDFNVKMFVKW